MVIILKSRYSRFEHNITYVGSSTTISKTYVDYFTIIIFGKTDKHNDYAA